MVYSPPGPSGMPEGYAGPYAPGYTPLPEDWGQTGDPMYVEPGAWLQLAEEDNVLEKYVADQQAEIDRLQIALGKEANAIERDKLKEQIRAAKADLKFRYEELYEKRRVTELGLANSPIDFVAYEMYKRYLQGQADEGKPAVSPRAAASTIEGILGDMNIEDIPPGLLPPGPTSTGREGIPRWTPPIQPGGQPARWTPPAGPSPGHPAHPRPGDPGYQPPTPTPTPAPFVPPPFAGPFSAPRTDEEIQAMIEAMVGEGGGTLGEGAFGVDVPMTQAISRQEGRGYSQDEMAILSSFLRAGFSVNGQEVSYDPADYWREVQEGWVPTIRTPESTQYAF